MGRCHTLFAVLLVTLAQRTANAHFVWIDARAAGDDTQVQLYFGESPTHGAKHLLDKIAHTEAWQRDAHGKITAVPIKMTQNGTRPALAGKCQATGPVSLEAFCDYGVYSHGGPKVLLYYYAKHLPADWLSDPKLAKSERLRLDIVPTLRDDKLAIRVTFDHKPVANKEVVVFDPEEMRHILTTDADGNAETPAPLTGRYAVRTGNIDTARAGEQDGKRYSQTWYYSTLIFDVAPPKATSPARLAE